jgi:hypothetical protein
MWDGWGLNNPDLSGLMIPYLESPSNGFTSPGLLKKSEAMVIFVGFLAQ